MNFNKDLTFQKNSYFHPDLNAPIKFSIGNPTVEKIQQVLDSYKYENQYNIVCFDKTELISVIGFERLQTNAKIRHISVLPKRRL